MVIAVLFPVSHPMGSTSDEAWYWQGRGRGGTLCNIFFVQHNYLTKMCMSPSRASLWKARMLFSSIQLKCILSVDRAVKSLVTVEYQHAVIRSNVTLLSDGLEILTIHLMGHIIVFYQRL